MTELVLVHCKLTDCEKHCIAIGVLMTTQPFSFPSLPLTGSNNWAKTTTKYSRKLKKYRFEELLV